MFRHFFGCGFAMAWAQNLLGFCLFACASQTPFSWVWPGGLQASKSYVAQRFALLEATFSLFLIGSKSNVSAVFWLRFRMVWALSLSFQWVPKATFRHFSGCGLAMAWAQNLLGFCLFACAPQTPFSCVGLVACRLPSLTLRCALLDATFRNLFSLFLVGSKSNVSAVFWLRFRMVWALYFFLFIGFQKRRFGILLAAVSQWLRHKTYWGSAFSHARPKHLFLEFGLVTCRFFLCF